MPLSTPPRAALTLAFLCGLGCGTEPPPRPMTFDAGERDASRPVRDGGPAVDAGPREPVIDGVVGETEWRRGESATGGGGADPSGSRLLRLRARLADGRLSVAVEGTLAAGDTLVVYVDGALGEPVGVEDTSTLADTDRPLDRALSHAYDVPAGFAPDLAFGSDTMPRAVVGLDESAGWRDLTGRRDEFRWLSGEDAPVVCGAAACEAAVDLVELGGRPPRTVALFARVVGADGAVRMTTLPAGDEATPHRVSGVLTIADGIDVRDGGVPDAGDAVPDAGTPFLVDGVIGEAEWAGVAIAQNATVAQAPFTGSALRTLRVARDTSRLRLAIEGDLQPGHAIVAYIDHDLGGGDGLASPTPLDDNFGALDRALTRSLFTPADFRIDYAWGTLDLGRAAAAGDPRMGFRDVATDPTNFRIAPGPSACGAGACEAAITLSDLGVRPGDDVGVFVRLVDATSERFSNQTLPMDESTTPEFVGVFARADAP